MQFRGHQYRQLPGIKLREAAVDYAAVRSAAAPAAVIDDRYWRGEQLLFWIVAVVDSKTGLDLPAKSKKLTAKTWEKLPAAIRTGVGQDPDVKQSILECIGRGTCHVMILEGGWLPGVKKGAKQVPEIQATLEWIQQFRERSAVSGSKLIWAEVNSQVKR